MHVHCRFLVFEEALVRGERPVLTGLLEDLHRACDAQPPAPSRVPAPGTGARPYLPYRGELLISVILYVCTDCFFPQVLCTYRTIS